MSDLTDFEKEIEALLDATLEQQRGWHEVMDAAEAAGAGDEPLPLEAHLLVLEARVNAYRVVILRLAREIAALKGESADPG